MGQPMSRITVFHVEHPRDRPGAFHVEHLFPDTKAREHLIEHLLGINAPRHTLQRPGSETKIFAKQLRPARDSLDRPR